MPSSARNPPMDGLIMQVQTVFRNSLSILQKVGTQLRLSLSEDPDLVAQQIQRIRRAQTHFLKLNQKIVDWFDPQRDETTYYAYTLLTQITQAMANEAHTLLLLAEEFPLDPEGTAACLGDAQIRIQRLLQQINTLKTERLKDLDPKLLSIKTFEGTPAQPCLTMYCETHSRGRVPYSVLVAAKAHQLTNEPKLAVATQAPYSRT